MVKFEDVFTYINLYESFLQCRHGQMWKDSVISFDAKYAEKLLELQEEILNQTYFPLPDNVHYIHERGKVRKIHSQHIRDRIVHKLLNQMILRPTFHKRFIMENTASQLGKGMDFAIRLFKKHLNQAYRKWGNDFYILKLDIRKYFENIPHDYIERLLREEIKDKRIMRLALHPLLVYEGDKGIGLGSEVNQTYALLCLDRFDHIVKEELHIKEYARYMDDSYIMLDDKYKLNEILKYLEEYLNSIGLELNKQKSQIIHIKNTITFIGFKWFLTDTGHVMILPRKATIIRNKKKLRKYKTKLDERVFTRKEIENCYGSMRGHFKRCNCISVINRMDSYYDRLFRNEIVFENPEKEWLYPTNPFHNK